MRRSGKTRKVLLDDGWKMGKVMLGEESEDENRKGNEMRRIVKMIGIRQHDNVRSPKKEIARA